VNLLSLIGGRGAILQLVGQDRTCRVLRSRLENLVGKKDHRHFDDRKEQGEE